MNLLSVSSVLSVIGSVLLAILILLAMITVHEFGHYVAGKALKFKINEFAVGFGPKLFKRTSKKSGELFSVRALPLGGFCAFEGEDGEEGESDGAFVKMAPWKRIIVLISGPLMNYVLALLLIIISMFAFGQPVYRIDGVAPADGGTVYSQYSLKEGDLLLKVNGTRVFMITDITSALNGAEEGDTVSVLVFRGGKEVAGEVMLRASCNFTGTEQASNVWRALGLDTHVKADGNKYWSVGVEGYRHGFFGTIGNSFLYSFKIAGTIFKVLGELFTGQLGLSSFGGPVTTIKLTSEIASKSAQSFFEIAAYIGINLAVFNLLPIPALDGSKVVFCLIEWIFRKPVPRKIEAVIHSVGFILILVFAVTVDIIQFAGC